MSAVRWFEPSEDLSGELVLSGRVAAAMDTLERELRQVPRFLAAGVDPPTRALFSGPSGTGKTLAARWLAWRLRAAIGVVDVAAVIGSTLGASSKGLRECFEEVSKKAGALLFLDEIDAICMRREGVSDGADVELARVTTTFFQQIDWLPMGRIVVAATNFAGDLDPALRRRLPTEIVFEAPDRDARRRMLSKWLLRAPLCEEQLDTMADETEGLSGAELRAHAMAAARRAVMALPEEPRSPRRRVSDADRDPNSRERAQELLLLVGGESA